MQLAGDNQTDLAYQALEDMIVTMALAPGARVVEASLMKELPFGRTPLREAMMRLAAEGLLVAQPRRGMVVRELGFASQMKVYETRRALELVLVPAAARRRSAEQARALKRIMETFTEKLGSEDPHELLLADRSFIALLVSMSGNPFMRQLLPLYSLSRRFWLAYRSLFARRYRDEQLTEFHIQIAAAVIAGDEAAALERATAFLNFVESYTLYVGRELAHSPVAGSPAMPPRADRGRL
ncbi:GntR family transcriptional regulator [Frigidibacter sp. MR17.24]